MDFMENGIKATDGLCQPFADTGAAGFIGFFNGYKERQDYRSVFFEIESACIDIQAESEVIDRGGQYCPPHWTGKFF